jgi:FAD:protein FMN transferase
MMTRRRALGVFASLAGLAALPRASGSAFALEWKGAALGAEARIALWHNDRAAASRAIESCVAEIERLEHEFSLYRSSSALARLNRDGRLEAPSLDMRRLLQEAQRFGDLTGGAFDVTVQPLWSLYAEHFSTTSPDPPTSIDAALALIDYRAIDIAAARIALRPGMAVTLNGIAQGYITDRVADLLRSSGFDHVLVDAGEMRALSGRGDGRPWRIALDHPAPAAVDLDDCALATSSGLRAPFSADGRLHHLIDPTSGGCPDPARTVSVLAPSATVADALATALCLLPPEHRGAVLRRIGSVAAIVTEPDGTRRELRA